MWDSTTEQLLERASSVDPTPGGGAIAAVTAAFGLGLVRMSIAVTLPAAEGGGEELALLRDASERARELQVRMVAAADQDVAEFEALMKGYRMPRETDGERAARSRAIDDATVTATLGPLGLSDAVIVAVALADEVEPLVKRTIVSDVQAGRDLLRGAALAALRTADINLVELERRGHAEAPALRQRRDGLCRAAAGAAEDPCRPR